MQRKLQGWLDDERLIFMKKDIPADKNMESFQRVVHNVLILFRYVPLAIQRQGGYPREKGVSFSSQEIPTEFPVLLQTLCENLSKSLSLKSTEVI